MMVAIGCGVESSNKNRWLLAAEARNMAVAVLCGRCGDAHKVSHPNASTAKTTTTTATIRHWTMNDEFKVISTSTNYGYLLHPQLIYRIQHSNTIIIITSHWAHITSSSSASSWSSSSPSRALAHLCVHLIASWRWVGGTKWWAQLTSLGRWSDHHH